MQDTFTYDYCIQVIGQRDSTGEIITSFPHYDKNIGILQGHSKSSHPYSYDPFVVWETEGKANSSVYSDRLCQWDMKKHNQLCLKHFGDEAQYWANRNPKLIEAFLQDWNDDKNIKLVRIIEYCNMSS